MLRSGNGEGIPKPPILFSDRLFSSLLDLTGDKGARDILRDGSLHGLHLPAPDPLLFADADTMEAYNRLKQMKKRSETVFISRSTLRLLPGYGSFSSYEKAVRFAGRPPLHCNCNVFSFFIESKPY